VEHAGISGEEGSDVITHPNSRVSFISHVFRSIALACALLAFVLPAQGKPRDTIYSAPIDQAAHPPGTLLRYLPLQAPPFYRVKAWRILYATRDYRGRPILSTGMVVLPAQASRDPQRRSIVAWAHPTTGIAQRCAPSLAQSPLATILGLGDLIASGHIIAATDYPGLGTTGPVGYMVGKGQANAVMDAVRAARQIPGVGGSSSYALMGYSQGAHAAVFASLFASSYAPELQVVGLAAIAPPLRLRELMLEDVGTMEGRVLSSYIISSWSRKYGISTEALLAPEALETVDRIAGKCVNSFEDSLKILSAQRELKQRFLAALPTDLPEWRSALANNSVNALAVGVPAVIFQGTADNIVRPEITREVVRTSCRNGTVVKLVSLAGTGHGGAARASAASAVRWINDRFAGKPVPTSCK
jgi:alpha-beta hydrolase superfamily lysophospholipase